jgi:DNA polymerase I-like protein with 3'-5' exonuclease and polymerase domains
MSGGLFWTEKEFSNRKTNREEKEAAGPQVRVTKVRAPRRVETGPLVPRFDVDWRPPTEFIPMHGITSIDFETRDTTLGTIGSAWAFPSENDYVIGVAVASCGRSAYYPIRHEGGDNMPDPGKVWEYLADGLKDPGVHMVAANSLYDLGWLRQHGIKPVNGAVDVQGLAALVDENRLSYSLDNLAKDLLGKSKDEGDLSRIAAEFGIKNIKEHLWRLPARFAGPYAEQDAVLNIELFKHLMKQVKGQDLLNIAELEREIMTISVEMRMHGVRVNLDRAEMAKQELQQKEDAAIERIRQQSDVNISAWEAASIEKALTAVGIELPRTATGKPSVTKAWLEANPSLPLVQDILEVRRYNKARTTFIDGHVFNHARNGRIHPEFHPLRREEEDGSGYGTVGGRFSCSNPNLQQLPSRDPEIMKFIRCLMEPEIGERWENNDYSSQEPRLTLHWASFLGLEGASQAVDILQKDPRTDYHKMCAEWMGGIGRFQAKTLNLGITYGMGGASLCKALGLPTETRMSSSGHSYEVAGIEGQRILDLYHERIPYANKLAQRAQLEVKQNGYITTILGRRCRFPMKGNEYMFLNKSLNRRIQGSAADQTKKAMVLLYREGILPLITEHDALGFSVDADPVKKARRIEIMEHALPEIRVPMVVDSKTADNWGLAKEE